jgi:hypothetical protein
MMFSEVWIAALFALGFAVGWFARDRRSRRRRKRLSYPP